MLHLSEQSCGLEQANHRKTMSINQIDPTVYGAACCLLLAHSFPKRRRRTVEIRELFAQIILFFFQLVYMLVILSWFYASQEGYSILTNALSWMHIFAFQMQIQHENQELVSSDSKSEMYPYRYVWEMDYCYKPRLKYGFQWCARRMENCKVMFQAFQCNSFLSFSYLIWGLKILHLTKCVIFAVFKYFFKKCI